MRVRSEKTLLFKGDSTQEIIRKGEIKDLSDWVAKTDIFNLAKAEGSLLVIATKNDKKKAENEENLTPTDSKK